MKKFFFCTFLIIIFSCPAFAGVPASGVAINTHSLTLAFGMDNGWLGSTVIPSIATNKNVIWSSNNEAVVTVESLFSGSVAWVKATAPGTAVITATTEDGGYTDTCTVMVVDTGIRNVIPKTFTDVSEAAAKIVGFGEGGFETVNGNVFIKKSIIETIAMQLSDDIVEVTSLPCIKAEIQSGKVAALRTIFVGATILNVPLNYFLHPEELLVFSIISPDAGELMKYAPTMDDLDDGAYTILPISSVSETLFELVACVKDGGRFDLDKIENGLAVTQVAILKTEFGEKLELNKSLINMLVGETERLAVTGIPYVESLGLSSSNTAVATVDKLGLVTAISPGTATITVSTMDGGKSATCVVVVEPIPAFSLNKKTTNIQVGETDQLAVTSTNVGNLVWSSSNEAIASVNSAGLVTGISPGAAIITVRTEDGSNTATCEVNITIGIPVLILDKSSATIETNKTLQLVATIMPFDPNINFTWSSSNEAIASVNSAGLVTGISTGTATITVRTEDGGHNANCEVTVIPLKMTNPTHFELIFETTNIQVGDNLQIIAKTVPDEHVINQYVTWSSSNEAIASVNSAGLVTGISTGTATITARTEDGEALGCAITVAFTGVNGDGNSGGGCNVLYFWMFGFVLALAVLLNEKITFFIQRK